jgi:hypothetical protein
MKEEISAVSRKGSALDMIYCGTLSTSMFRDPWPDMSMAFLIGSDPSLHFPFAKHGPSVLHRRQNLDEMTDMGGKTNTKGTFTLLMVRM